MLDITVKTMSYDGHDGHNRCYSIPDNYTVRQFKEKISVSLNIPVDRQRLIFQGREMKDEKYLKDFDVNGKTIHLVQRAPPSLLYQSRQNDQSRLNRVEVNSPTRSFTTRTEGSPNNNTTGMQNSNDLGGIQTILNQILGGLSESIQNTTNNEGSLGLDIHIDVGNMTQTINEQDIRNRIDSIKRLIIMANNRLKRIEEIQSGAPLDNTANNAETQHESPSSNTYNTHIETLGNLVNDVMVLYSKFQPHLLEYYSLLLHDTNEPVIENNENRRQRFCNNISDMLHLFGHLFHNLSDLHVNLRDQSPRNIRTMVPFQTAIISTTATPIFATAHTIAQNLNNTTNQMNQQTGENFNQNEARFLPVSQPEIISSSISIGSNNSVNPNLQQSRETDASNFNADNTRVDGSSTNTSTNPASNITNQQSQVFSNTSPLTRDPFLQCNSVHFFNSLVNNAQLVSNSSRNTNINMIPTYHSTRLAVINNGSQRRRHPASDQNSNQNPGSTGESSADSGRLLNQFVNQQLTNNSLNNTRIQPELNSFMREIPAPIQTNTGPRFASGENARSRLSSFSNLIRFLNVEQYSGNNGMGTEMLREILTIVDSSNANDERLQRPISQIIGSFNTTANSSESNQSNSFVWSLVDNVFKSMTLMDMMNLATAQSLDEVFKNTQEELKTYIQNSLNINEANFISNQDAIIDKLYLEICADLDLKFDDFEVLDKKIDIKQSMERMIKNHLKLLLNHILKGSKDKWGQVFYQKIIDFKNHTVALLRSCIKDANSKISKLLCLYLEQTIFSPESNQMIRNTFHSFIADHLNEMINNTIVDNESITQFIVYKSELKLEANKNINEMLIKEKSNISSSNNNDKDDKRILPIAWIETISKDKVFQKNYQHRFEFSSAYKTGVHYKRRKLVKNMEDGSSNSFFDAVIHRTVSRMHNRYNLNSRTSPHDEFHSPNMVKAFDDKLDRLIKEKLSTNSQLNKTTEVSSRYSLCYNAHKRLYQSTSSDDKLNFTKKRLF